MKAFVSCIILILLLKNLYSLDTNSTNLMPLKIGNVWTYERYSTWPPPGVYTRFKIIITKDTLAGNHRFYYCNAPTGSTTGWLRVDTATGLLLSYEPGFNCPEHQNQKTIDSLNSKRYDTTRSCLYYSFRICDFYDSLFIWGSTRKSKTFNNRSLSSDGRKYVEDIGLTNTWWGEIFTITHTLRGCIINGVLYGDTTVVGLNQISSEIPKSFSLFQNYPNPFNPVTKIKFSLPSPPWTSGQSSKGGALDVKLVVYDVLGREIANLIPPPRGGQEGLQPGTYEVEWNGTNYPSGVYFYKLITPEYTETRKMVLVK